MPNPNILFLTLQVFSATGGIEKVCRIAGKGLVEIAGEGGRMDITVFSVYDQQQDADEKYIPAAHFKGFAGEKLQFIKTAIKEGRRSGVVILSHINLLLIGFLIKLVSPKTKLVLFAHGIEVWGPMSLFRRLVLHRCNLILPVSNYTKDVMQTKYNLPEKKFRVINNCLDPFLPVPLHAEKDEGLMKKYGIEKSDFVLLTLTRLSSKEQYKGYDHVLFSLNELRKKYPSVKYIMVGKYDETEKSRLDKITGSLNIKEHVHFTGYIPDTELEKHYSLADLYVMPSKKEGFGIVFIEAMYYGLPVIAGNKDGSTDALYNGKLGILIDPDSQDELTTEIEKVILHKTASMPDHDLLMKNFSYPVYKDKLKAMIIDLTPKQFA